MPLIPDPTQYVAPPSSETDLSDLDRRLVGYIRSLKESSERSRRPLEDRWNSLGALYANYAKVRKAHSNDADVDRLLSEFRREFGEQIRIPAAFSTVETVLPRALSVDPKLKAIPKPGIEDGRERAKRVEQRFARDMRRTNYAFKLQPTARRGFIYGLGVQKKYWEHRTKKVRENVPRRFRPGFQTVEAEKVIYSGPNNEDVEIFDFFWDTQARSIETAEWVLHRTWRSYSYVRKQVESGVWMPVDLEAVKRMGRADAYKESRKARDEVAGLSTDISAAEGVHEVWEFHRGEKVITILDQTLPVQNARNPAFHGEFPFQAFRPIPKGGEFAGYGVIEHIAPLIFELDELRTLRLDNATVATQTPFFYQEGLLEEENIVFGPGTGIPVLGNPNDIVSPFRIGEPSGLGYQEEAAMKDDMDRTTGISDPVAGGESGAPSTETATGLQLTMQAANVRVAQMTKNLTNEVIAPEQRQALELYKQYVLEPDTFIPDPANPEEVVEVSPEDFQAIEDIVPEDGSTEPDNPLQRQQSATTLYQNVTANPQVDQTKALLHLLREHDIRDPETWVIPDLPRVDPQVLGQVLAQFGITPEQTMVAMDQAVAAANGGAPAEGQPAPSENGAQPTQEVPQ